MPDRTRRAADNAKAIDRWDDEGGAPSGGEPRKRSRDIDLQKKAAAKKKPQSEEAGSKAR